MGITGIQFAKASGLTVVTTASPKNFAYIKTLGADAVFDYKSPTLVEDVRGFTGGKLQYAWDCQANETSARICAQAISEAGGKYAALLYGAEDVVRGVNAHIKPAVSLYYTVFGERYSYGGQTRDPVPEALEFGKMFWEMSRGLLASGAVRPIRVIKNQGGAGLEGVLKGLEDIRDGNYSAGKLVYTL